MRVGPCALRVNQALGIRGLITKAATLVLVAFAECKVETVVEHNCGGGGGGKRATTQVLQQYSSRFFTFSPDFVV